MSDMETITATELQLLECFGVEPQLLDPRDPWCYNDAAYLVELDGLSISFAIAPAYRDVRLMVRRCDQRIYELNAMSVTDVRVLDEPGREPGGNHTGRAVVVASSVATFL